MKKGYGVGRGFAGGLIWGVLAAVFCLLCVVAYQSMTPEKSPETISLEVPAGSEFNQSRDDKAARSPKEISIANRAKIVKSELTEPDQASGVDRTIGSSAKVPTADANTISGLSNTSSTGSEMSIQRSPSLAEKPNFASRSMQKPAAPRAEGADKIFSETPSSLPKEEIFLKQQVKTKLPTPEIEVSLDPTGPNLADENIAALDEPDAKFEESSPFVELPSDLTMGAAKFSELELQVSPQLPDADFSVMMNTDTASTLPKSALRNPVSETRRDEVNDVDFSGLKETDEHTGFANLNLSVAPQMPTAMQVPSQDTAGPQLQQPVISLGETSQLALLHKGPDEKINTPAVQGKAPNSFMPGAPQALDIGPVVQDTDIKPSNIGQDVSADGFGAEKNTTALTEESRNTPTAINADKSIETSQNATINSLDQEAASIPILDRDPLKNDAKAQGLEPETNLIEQELNPQKTEPAFQSSEPNISRPIEAFAASKVPQEDKPILSIVLVVDEQSQVDIQALKDIPFPLSLGIDVANFEGAKLMNLYRSNGFEVAAIVDYPNAASEQEINDTLVSGLNRLDKTIAVIEGSPGNLQKTRSRSEQTASILSQSGHGLLVHEKGLNTIVREAKALGVPVRTIYRDLIELTGDSRTFRRFLDGAAFRARQEGKDSAIVVTASLHPETLGALLLWSLQNRSQSVTIAPLSQALTLGL